MSWSALLGSSPESTSGYKKIYEPARMTTKMTAKTLKITNSLHLKSF